MPILYIFECEKCYLRSMPSKDLKEIKQNALNRGWIINEQTIICPVCKVGL